MEVFFLNAGKKWPNESLKVQASKIRRLAREANEPIPSDEEILQRFIKEGKIKAAPSYEKTMGAVDPVLRSDGKKYPPEERSRSISKSRHKRSPDQNDETKLDLIDPNNIPEGLREGLDLVRYGKQQGIELKLSDVKPFLQIQKVGIPWIDLEPAHDNETLKTREYLLMSESIQRQMYISMQKGKCMFAVGVRGTAKTFTVKQFFAKQLVTQTNYELHMFCGKEMTAKANLDEIRDWLLKRGVTEDAFEIDNATTLKLHNGSYIKAHANTQADIRKYRGKINWVDEAQLMDKPAFAAMLGLFSGVTDFQLVLTGNYGEITGCPFENFCRAEDRGEICHEMNIDFYELGEQDIHWTSDADKSKLRRLMDTMLGVQGTATQLDQTWVTPEGAKYESTWIQAAYNPIYFPTRMERVVAGMDWGDNGTTTIVVLGLGTDKHIYVLYVWAKKGATTSDVADKIWWCYTEFGAVFAWEKSPSGDFARKDIKEKYGTDIEFHDSSFSIYKEKFIYFIYRFLSIGYIHFIDQLREVSKDPLDLPYTKEELTQLQIMRTEFERYCGDKKQDHRHDALAHALYYIVSKDKTMVEFIEKVYAQQRGMTHVQTT